MTTLTVNMDSGPVGIDADLHRIERRPTRTGYGWFAKYAIGKLTFEASKLDGETAWRIDSCFGSTGLPLYVHGYGSRCCAKDAPIPEVAAWLDAEQAATIAEVSR